MKANANNKIVKKIFLSLIATVLSVFAYAQKDTPSIAPHATPHIRCERKELKREHYADRSQKLEMRIHRDKRELRHIRNGKTA